MTSSILSQSRFIAFFDESGDHSLTKVDPDFPLFVLSTVIVERSVYAKEIIPAVADFKLRYFAHEGMNLHSRDIRKAEGPFIILQSPDVRQQFLAELSELMQSLPFTLFTTCIKKEAYKKRYGEGAKNPYDIALEYTFERILHFMEVNQTFDLPVIAEARGKQEDNALRASFQKLLTEGTYYNNALRFNTLNCPISFRQKRDNICGIQMADLCAHPTARHVLQPNGHNQAFSAVKGHFYQGGCVNGLKVFPK